MGWMNEGLLMTALLFRLLKCCRLCQLLCHIIQAESTWAYSHRKWARCVFSHSNLPVHRLQQQSTKAYSRSSVSNDNAARYSCRVYVMKQEIGKLVKMPVSHRALSLSPSRRCHWRYAQQRNIDIFSPIYRNIISAASRYIDILAFDAYPDFDETVVPAIERSIHARRHADRRKPQNASRTANFVSANYGLPNTSLRYFQSIAVTLQL